MSGGIAYVFDEDRQLSVRCNLGLVELEKVEAEEDISELKGLIERHLQFTNSGVAKRILDNWETSLSQFRESDANGLQACAPRAEGSIRQRPKACEGLRSR